MINTPQVDGLARIIGLGGFHCRLILSHQTASPHALYDVLGFDGRRGKTISELVDSDRELRGFPQGSRRKNLSGWFLKKIHPWGTVLKICQCPRQLLVETWRGAGTCDDPCILGRVLDSTFMQVRVRSAPRRGALDMCHTAMVIQRGCTMRLWTRPGCLTLGTRWPPPPPNEFPNGSPNQIRQIFHI